MGLITVSKLLIRGPSRMEAFGFDWFDEFLPND